jgi:hypothetical protein
VTPAVLLKALGGTLGLLQQAPRAYLQGGSRPGRVGHPGADRRPGIGQGGAQLCRGRPHPRRAGRAGHRAQGLGPGHDLGRPEACLRAAPPRAMPNKAVCVAPALPATPDYWDEACRHLARATA